MNAFDMLFKLRELELTEKVLGNQAPKRLGDEDKIKIRKKTFKELKQDYPDASNEELQEMLDAICPI